jgi:hypothetical protein
VSLPLVTANLWHIILKNVWFDYALAKIAIKLASFVEEKNMF